MRITHVGFILAIAFAVTSCGRTDYAANEASQPAGPSSIAAAPVGGVQQSQLPPPSGDNGMDNASTAMPGDETGPSSDDTGDQTQMASLPTGTGAPSISREALLGRWTTSTGSSTCDLFLSLTKWTGGYRAASRNCAGIAEDISAWDVKNNTVVLSDSTGNRLATLTKAGDKSYTGTTQTGQSINLSR
ncbi:AprI/Inh family metalloprotease inhibitor [Pararhizobium mangrovi]|uniref:Outer membrane lipoprotein omp19 n=1 Tax=Pararhizobium mangrovi TaxID=2590452 RepID=A0A506U0U7_9HYPH|nr:AprI/Inh family metalloprotease inhibitor [Pararhizobium mangrovi]TPW27972.1 hypothetical protein FJU11_10545 [Pararhizobium mangrovi]